MVSIIEFSDMECPYCITQHKKEINKDLLENHSDKVNYSFKNFPLPAHKNANIEAQAAKCVEKLESGEKYLEYIENIFNTTD
ncbi:DsbA family protein [Patescibacteria group bacterium]